MSATVEGLRKTLARVTRLGTWPQAAPPVVDAFKAISDLLEQSWPATTVEVDLGSTPVKCGTFTITDSDIVPGTSVLVWQAPGPYTGKGTLADECELDSLRCIATPGNGSARVFWHVNGYGSGSSWVGLVKGNFKFSYQVMG